MSLAREVAQLLICRALREKSGLLSLPEVRIRSSRANCERLTCRKWRRQRGGYLVSLVRN
jgi:hypothetical protein